MLNIGGNLVCPRCKIEKHDDLPEKSVTRSYPMGSPLTYTSVATAVGWVSGGSNVSITTT